MPVSVLSSWDGIILASWGIARSCHSITSAGKLFSCSEVLYVQFLNGWLFGGRRVVVDRS